MGAGRRCNIVDDDDGKYIMLHQLLIGTNRMT